MMSLRGLWSSGGDEGRKRVLLFLNDWRVMVFVIALVFAAVALGFVFPSAGTGGTGTSTGGTGGGGGSNDPPVFVTVFEHFCFVAFAGELCLRIWAVNSAAR
jgi:hypothetical protein